jgi:hypothetical protein
VTDRRSDAVLPRRRHAIEWCSVLSFCARPERHFGASAPRQLERGSAQDGRKQDNVSGASSEAGVTLESEVRLDGGFVEFSVPSRAGHAAASTSEKLRVGVEPWLPCRQVPTFDPAA